MVQTTMRKAPPHDGHGRRKRYVEVVARHFEDGKLAPLTIAWDDGRVFAIDRVLDVRQAASLKVGGMGMRFIVRIGSRTTCLFFEGPRWFVEEIVPEEASCACAEDGCACGANAWDAWGA